ncbi:MAG TPA: Rne/Rng family ribonuclease [Mycobacteriales bacterium]|nr:Rne/Rng family ribonuclease [Mycobacteriales bacterium]
MLDDERTTTSSGAAGATSSGAAGASEPAAPKKTTRSRKKTAPASSPDRPDQTSDATAGADAAASAPKKTTAARKRTTKAKAAAEVETTAAESSDSGAVPAVIFQAPPAATAAPRKRAAKKTAAKKAAAPKSPATEATTEAGSNEQAPAEVPPATITSTETAAETEPGASEPAAPTGSRRRRGRRGRGGRGGAGGSDVAAEAGDDAASGDSDTAPDAEADDAAAGDAETDAAATGDAEGTGGSRRRRRRRRRTGDGESGGDEASDDDGVETVVHVREPRPKSNQPKSRDDDSRPGGDVKGVKGSTRLEAKRQRRREGRDTGRRRPPIITEAEFLARRESVERVMVVRQSPDRTQIAVLEDGILVEHYVARKDHTSMVGNVYLGKVQNVLPSMEAAFVDIGRGRNAVLYAGEVNYDASALDGRPPRIEQALKSGQSVLVQVTKDPIGHKGARLTSQVSLPGRYMVYVPDGRLSGISRKLPDTERSRLKGILKRLTPEEAGVIIRTAAEGASEEELERDLKRLSAQWEDIEKKAQSAAAPSMIYGEPDVVIRVIRDIFNEDFTELVVSGADEWDTVDNYVRWVAPDLAERARRWTDDEDIFAAYRIDEQLAKALDRKVWLPSGGYLIIDRTEAMIVVDVNTGKFTGKGGNLEETVTKNNLEAAEEIVRQLRLRDLGGIIVIDFIDMVLESNRELVLRRLMECLGRDRTRHQVAEVTSLGLVQMTRKRVGEGLLEAFSEPCKECGGRGVMITLDPVADKRPKKAAKPADTEGGEKAEAVGDKPKRKRGGRGRGGAKAEGSEGGGEATAETTPAPEPLAVDA